MRLLIQIIAIAMLTTLAAGTADVHRALHDELRRAGGDAVIKQVGCVGMCHQVPMLEVVEPEVRGQPALRAIALGGGQITSAQSAGAAHAEHVPVGHDLDIVGGREAPGARGELHPRRGPRRR